jgi:pimeloyl-ACP methyl ester carboxylesterase
MTKAMSIPGQRIEVNGIHLNVYVEGEGPQVLLLHGFPDSNYLWRGVIPHLVQAGYRVIAPDQRGFGESAAPEGKEHYDMGVIAKDAIALLIWSTDDVALAEDQMIGSAAFVDAPWRYQRLEGVSH